MKHVTNKQVSAFLSGGVKAVRRLQNDEAAQRYAESDRSDPFALARARAHIKQGSLAFDDDGRCLYDAGKRP